MHILVIEDNSADIYLLNKFLAEHENAPTVHTMEDGKAALDYLFSTGHEDATRPDIILLDLGLPNADGYEVLRRIKADAACAAIPIVVLTNSRDPSDHVNCRTLGVDIFLSKPFGLHEFSQMVDRLLDWARLRLSANTP